MAEDPSSSERPRLPLWLKICVAIWGFGFFGQIVFQLWLGVVVDSKIQDGAHFILVRGNPRWEKVSALTYRLYETYMTIAMTLGFTLALVLCLYLLWRWLWHGDLGPGSR